MRKTALSITVWMSALASIVFAGTADFSAPALSEQSREPQSLSSSSAKSKDYVDMKSDEGWQMEHNGTKIFVVRGNFAAHHNGTVITADSAVRYSEKRIECFGNVLINKGTTYIYGDRAEYDGDTNIARVYANIVKVMDGDAVLYTYNFRFNTKSNVGRFSGGGVVQSGTNMLESERGYYYGDSKQLICVDRVQMRNDTYEMKADSVIYDTEKDFAQFFTNTNIWNTGQNEYLSADQGSFDKKLQLYTLTRNGYILTENQELYCDTLDYYRDRGYARLKNNVQIDDREQKVLAFGDWAEYWKEPGNALLARRPSIISYDTSQGDSLFMRADSMFLYTHDPIKERVEQARKDSLQRVADAARADSIAKATAKNTTKDAAQTAASGRELPGDAPSRMTGKGAKREKSRRGDVRGGDEPRGEALRRQAEKANNAVKEALAVGHEASRANGDVVPRLADAASMPQAAPTTTDSLGAAVVRDTLKRDTLATDSLKRDTTKSPLDTMSKQQLRDYYRAEKAKVRDSLKLIEKHRRDSIKQVKAEALSIKLDSIGEQRQAKRTEMYRKMEIADSIRLAKEQERADAALRRKLARLEKRGIYIEPIGEAVWRSIDSLLTVEQRSDSLFEHKLDSIILIYFPRVAEDSVVTDTAKAEGIYRIVRAYRKVKIFRSDFQTVCDSLTTDTRDSIINMYKSPVMWNGASQIFSDVMHIHTRGGALDRAVFDGKPMTISQIDTAHYNQIAGKEMVSFFRDNQIYRNDVNGNVQTIYYMQEDNSSDINLMAYIEAADMTSYIKDQQVEGITYRGNPTYTFYPIDKIPETQATRLDGFRWEASRRPARDSVFNRVVRPSLRLVKESLRRPDFPINRTMEQRKTRLLRLHAWSDRTDTLSAETHEWLESLTSPF